MNQKIHFYQNNPCVIIRDVNDLFCEIQLNTHFAANITGSMWCEPCNIDSKSSHTHSEYDEVIEEIQDEEHSIICMIEKRLLHDEPIEVNTIKSLKRIIDDQNYEFAKTKSLHEEWRLALNAQQAKSESLTAEIKSLMLDVDANKGLREQSEDGLKALTDEYNKIAVVIGYGVQKITTQEHDELLKRDERLRALEAGGVDNWEWYDESIKNANL